MGIIRFKKDDNVLELRMYFFVPYNISEIQKGIQAGHCALEYAYAYGDTEIYQEFFNFHKTWIILNGGTTRERLEDPGTMQEIYTSIFEYNLKNSDDPIKFVRFNEPDLNETTTAICFICDERVWDIKKYPTPVFFQDTDPSEQFESYEHWVEFMGGKKNVFLRELTWNKNLA